LGIGAATPKSAASTKPAATQTSMNCQHMVLLSAHPCLVACLADDLKKDVIEPLSAGIVEWIKELAPAVDTRVVFKDSSFADDIAKTYGLMRKAAPRPRLRSRRIFQRAAWPLRLLWHAA
jgi:hypothetical protein